MKKILIPVFVIAAIIIFYGTAGAITYKMSWTGDAGYSMNGTFSFDETMAGTEFTESNFGTGPGITTILESLSVSFYDPSNNLLDSYDIVASHISNPIFSFSFNVTNEVVNMPFVVAGPDPDNDWFLGSEEEGGSFRLYLSEGYGNNPDSTDGGDAIISVSRVGGYNLGWWFVQHRVFENGTEYNRLLFGLQDDMGNYPTESVVDTVVLTDPDGFSVPLENIRFWQDSAIYGHYDGSAGKWYYDEDPGYEAGHAAEFAADFKEGTYHLTVTDLDGGIHEGDYEFNGLVSLPIISSSTFSINFPYNYCLWEWKIEESVYALSLDYETRVKAIIEVYKDDQYAGEGYFDVPTHMGKILIPPDVLDDLKSLGNRFEFKIQLRTRDNNNRTYSNPIVFP